MIKLPLDGKVMRMALGYYKGTNMELFVAAKTVASLQVYRYNITVNVGAYESNVVKDEDRS